jgi:hypothetical protein
MGCDSGNRTDPPPEIIYYIFNNLYIDESKMTDATRGAIWSILSDAFRAILRSLQATMPEARMTAGHSHDKAFPFRAYAEYSMGDRVVELSFDVQVKGSQLHAFGDIALEDGLVVKDLMQAVVGPESCEEVLITHAREFALQSQRNTDLIARKLGLLGRDPAKETREAE